MPQEPLEALINRMKGDTAFRAELMAKEDVTERITPNGMPSKIAWRRVRRVVILVEAIRHQCFKALLRKLQVIQNQARQLRDGSRIEVPTCTIRKKAARIISVHQSFLLLPNLIAQLPSQISINQTGFHYLIPRPLTPRFILKLPPCLYCIRCKFSDFSFIIKHNCKSP